MGTAQASKVDSMTRVPCLVLPGLRKPEKTAEKLKNRLFHKNRFFDNFKLNMGGLRVSRGMAWTVRTDFLELWRDLVLHGMGEVDFHVFGKYWKLWKYSGLQIGPRIFWEDRAPNKTN